MTDGIRDAKRVLLSEYSVENEASLIRWGLRCGIIYDSNIAILAMLHHEPSMMAMDGSVDKLIHSEHVLSVKEPRDVIDMLTLWDRNVAVMVACGVAHKCYPGRARALANQAVELCRDPDGIKKARPLYQIANYKGVRQIREILHSIIHKRRQHAIDALRQMYVTMEDKDFFEATWRYILPVALEGIICA